MGGREDRWEIDDGQCARGAHVDAVACKLASPVLVTSTILLALVSAFVGGHVGLPPRGLIAGATACRTFLLHGATRGSAAPRPRRRPSRPPVSLWSVVTGVGEPAPDLKGIHVNIAMVKEMKEMAMDEGMKDQARRRNWKMAVFGLQLQRMEESIVALGEAKTAGGVHGVGVPLLGLRTSCMGTSTPIGIVIDIDVEPPWNTERGAEGDIGVAQFMVPPRSPRTSTSLPGSRPLEDTTTHRGGQCVSDAMLPTRLGMDTHRLPARAVRFTVLRALHARHMLRPTRPSTLVTVGAAPCTT